MKKVFKLSVIGLLISLVFSCLSAPATVSVVAFTYDGDKAIYPAIYYAIKNGEPTVWRKSITRVTDEGNTIAIRHVQGNDGVLNVADFTFTIALKDNTVDYTFGDIHKRTAVTTSDTIGSPVDDFVSYDKNMLPNYFNEMLIKVMNDEALYSQAKEEADKTWDIVIAPKNQTASVKINKNKEEATPPKDQTITETIKNPNNYLIYPAIGKIITGSSIFGPNVGLKDINCLSNSFTISGVLSVVEGLPIPYFQYNIKVSMDNENLNIEFLNFSEYVLASLLKNPDEIQPYNAENIVNKIIEMCNKVLSSKDEYNSAKSEYFSNAKYFAATIASLSSIKRDEFIKSTMKGTNVSYEVSIIDVKTNTDKEYPSYKYKISSSVIYDTSNFEYFYVDIYTNDENVTNYSSREEVKIKGIIDNVKNMMLRESLVLIK